MSQFRSFYTKGDLPYVPLDEMMDLYDFSSLIIDDELDEDIKKEQIEFLRNADEIAERYLNVKELCIYNLVIHGNKRTADITTILGYNSWRAAQNAIERVFKILKLYMEFEEIDKEILDYEIKRNFSKFDQRVILYIESRLTIHQINKKLGKKFHYSKTQSLIKNILARLADSGGVCRQYYGFLIEIRKFKNSCNFDNQRGITVLKEEVRI